MIETTQSTRNNVPLVIICITILASEAAGIGGWLLWKGFAGGGEMIITLNTAISGLIGFIGGRAAAQAQAKLQPQPQTPEPDPNLS